MTAETATRTISTVEGLPDLDEVAGDWIDASELAHLPSLRNQQGQAHVNRDLTSLSWTASPPFSFGYHTGALRLDGVVAPTHRYRWKPWGVRREHSSAVATIRTDTRMALSANQLHWQVEVRNDTDVARAYTLRQDLFAMLTHTEGGWGWLYDVAWTSDNYHDFITLERIRDTTSAHAPYLLNPGLRRVRLGRPRLPGIQRDEDTAPMLMEYELPSHVSRDTPRDAPPSVSGLIRGIRCGQGSDHVFEHLETVPMRPTTEVSFGSFELRAGLVLSFDFCPSTGDESGVILTHGNHPDSLQLGLDNGRLWLRIAGEREQSAGQLAADRWHTISVVLDDEHVTLVLDGAEVGRTRHWSLSPRWTASSADGVVEIADGLSPARAAYAFDTPATRIETLGAGARATWAVTLQPGQTFAVGIVCAYGTARAAVLAEATAAAADFPVAFAATETGWRRHWRNMFTPDSGDFSGHLPVLRADDPQLARAYYMGVLTVLYLRNLTVSGSEPTFLTGGPRLGPTTTFYWDHAEWSRMYALLEPRGLRSWLRRVLSGSYQDSFGIDVKQGGPLGNYYAANDYSLFRLTEHYICLTGDTSFLDEQAGGGSVEEHLRRLAYGWRDRRDPATGGVLADFGDDSWRLLECVPNYVNVVASFNAAYVSMMRSLASLLRWRGRHDDADVADADAARLAAAVLDLYAGQGRWSIRHRGYTDTVGHCLDFGLVAAALHDDLSPAQRTEMVGFVVEHLRTGSWMRALSPDDPHVLQALLA